jgi:hypothetical protein
LDLLYSLDLDLRRIQMRKATERVHWTTAACYAQAKERRPEETKTATPFGIRRLVIILATLMLLLR